MPFSKRDRRIKYITFFVFDPTITGLKEYLVRIEGYLITIFNLEFQYFLDPASELNASTEIYIITDL